MTTVQDVVAALDVIAPPALALEGDPVGLHSGSPGSPVRRVLLSLDATREAVGGARKGDMLVVHHPRFYRGLKTLRLDDAAGGRGALIAEKRLPVFSAHTNLDVVPGGTNDCLAAAAGLTATEPVKRTFAEKLVKIVVFVPADHLEKVLRAMTAAGAGAIGKYSECTFRTRGVGTFRCGEGTKPFQGRPGSREEADEYRLETVVGAFMVDGVVEAMLSSHPYEEAAYDLYSLSNRGRVFGLGRVGDLAKAMRVDALAARAAGACGSRMAQYQGRGTVRRVAVWAGGGVDAEAVFASGAEALVAGEVGYHELEAFLERGVSVITLGHGPSEEPVLSFLAKKLRGALKGVRVQRCGGGRIAMNNIYAGTRPEK